MAGSVNKVILIGNLGAAPDVRTTPSGQIVASLSLATSETYTDKAGEKKTTTEWHRVQVWGKLAELAQRYLGKGRKVFVEGRIQTRSWDDQQSGQKRYSTEIVANNLVFLDSGSGGGGAQGGGPQGNRGAPYGQDATAPGAPAGDEWGGDDGVPF